MTPGSAWRAAVSIATLEEIRTQLRSRRGAALVASLSAVFALVSLLVGQMLVLGHEPGPYWAEILGAGGASQWWNYPAILAVEPWGVLSLPFWPTIAMVVVSLGVGLGMAVAIRLGIQLVRYRRTVPKAPGFTGLGGALTPAMIALVTLGACCSTSAVALASIGATAQVTGTTVDNLLFNSWYLPLFQIVVLWIALVAQEQLVRVYGRVLGLSPADRIPVAVATPPIAISVRTVLTAALRIALVFAGATWGLALLAEWTAPAAPAASAATWFQIVVQHLLPAGAALTVALFPSESLRVFQRLGRSTYRSVSRLVLLVAGIGLVGYFPPPLAGSGIVGFANGALGLLGAPGSWGAVAPSNSGLVGWGLLGVQSLLLGVICLALSLVPERTLGWLVLSRPGDPSTGSVLQAAGPSTPAAGSAPPATLTPDVSTTSE